VVGRIPSLHFAWEIMKSYTITLFYSARVGAPQYVWDGEAMARIVHYI
jgi:hypothetical protein